MWSVKVHRGPPRRTHYRYIVIGAGTSGCVVANRLARSGFSTLLVEAGSGGTSPYSYINPITFVPAGYLLANGHKFLDWCLKTSPDPGIDGRSLPYCRGLGLGGCSSVNGQIVNRGQRSDYDAWATLTGNEDWSWDKLLPVFKKFENYRGSASNKKNKHDEVVDPEKDPHGYAGEMPVVEQKFRYPVLEQARCAFLEAGFPANDDINCGDQNGVGFYEVNQQLGGGVRATTAGQFLAPVIGRKNLDVIAGSCVQKINFRQEGKRHRATGIVGTFGPRHMRWTADLENEAGEIILCAGALHSPALLQVSGIGPRRVLNSLGVDTVRVHEGVGKNMADHLQIRPVWKITRKSRSFAPYRYTAGSCLTLNTLTRSYVGMARIGLDYLTRRTGPLSMAPSQLGAFCKSGILDVFPYAVQERDEYQAAESNSSFSSSSSPSSSSTYMKKKSESDVDLQFHVQPLSLPAFGQPLHDFDGVTLSVCNLKPTSTGSVQAKSRDLTQGLHIETNYLSTERDQDVARLSIEKAREIAQQPALRDALGLEEVLPGPQVTSKEDLLASARRLSTTIFHPVGTCRMGNRFTHKEENPVIDDKLRVYDVDGLRIADASIMPRLTSGNTATPCMMIGEKAAEYILADSQHRFSKKFEHIPKVN